MAVMKPILPCGGHLTGPLTGLLWCCHLPDAGNVTDAIARLAVIYKAREICAQLQVPREHCDWSVRKFARAASVNASTVSRWERGERLPAGNNAVVLFHAAEQMAGLTGMDGDL